MSRPFGRREAAMLRRRVIGRPPPHGPDEAGDAAGEEGPPPIGAEHDRRDERRCDDGADGRAGVDDAHGRRALAGGEPLRDRLGGSGEATALAGAEQEPAERERAESCGQAVGRARERPGDHDDQEAAARPEAVDERAAAGVHHPVGGEKRDLQPREVGVAERDLLLNRGDGDRQRLTIQVADGDRDADDERHAPAE